LSGAYKTTEALGSILLGCGLPGATAATASMGDPSLQATGALGPACWRGLPGAMAAAASMGEPNLLAYSCYLWSSGIPGYCFHRGTGFLASQGFIEGSSSRGEHGSEFLCVPGS
jgi:hypothetical protein